MPWGEHDLWLGRGKAGAVGTQHASVMVGHDGDMYVCRGYEMRVQGHVVEMGCLFTENKLCRFLLGIHIGSRPNLFMLLARSPLE